MGEGRVARLLTSCSLQAVVGPPGAKGEKVSRQEYGKTGLRDGRGKKPTDGLCCQGAPGDLAGALLGEPVSVTPLTERGSFLRPVVYPSPLLLAFTISFTFDLGPGTTSLRFICLWLTPVLSYDPYVYREPKVTEDCLDHGVKK